MYTKTPSGARTCFRFIDRKHLKYLIPRGRDYDVMVQIIKRVSITRSQLLRLSRLRAAELDIITDRLVASGRIERNLGGSIGGRRVGLYELPHSDAYWGITV